MVYGEREVQSDNTTEVEEQSWIAKVEKVEKDNEDEYSIHVQYLEKITARQYALVEDGSSVLSLSQVCGPVRIHKVFFFFLFSFSLFSTIHFLTSHFLTITFLDA